jgi:hypothetical protein
VPTLVQAFPNRAGLLELVAQAVEHAVDHGDLGITVGEMEKRLRGGDANLMSWIVATTPVAWEAYRQYLAQTGSSSSDKNQPPAGGPQTARDEL